jgi:hypothetical protein
VASATAPPIAAPEPVASGGGGGARGGSGAPLIVAPEPIATTPPAAALPAEATPSTAPVAAAPVAAAPIAAAPAAATPALASIDANLRIVTREGYVRKALNLQAPADYELRDVSSKTVIEYLQPDAQDKDFKKYTGARVLVSGTEWLDRRWPTTPILQVQTVDPVP